MDVDLSRNSDGPVIGAREASVVSALRSLIGWKSFVEILEEYSTYVFQYRTKGEGDFVKRLAAFDPCLVAAWVD